MALLFVGSLPIGCYGTRSDWPFPSELVRRPDVRSNAEPAAPAEFYFSANSSSSAFSLVRDRSSSCSHSELRWLQCEREHLIDRRHDVELHLVAHLGRHIVQIGLVALRDDHFGEAGRVRSEDLLLEAANREHPALQRHFTGHTDRTPDRTPRQ